MWQGPDSVIVTELVEVPQYKALNFFLAGGDMRELEVMYPLIEEWGRQQGCTRAQLTGRKGWEKSFLKGLDWKPTSVSFEKLL